jgi:hypothetical protein
MPRDKKIHQNLNSLLEHIVIQKRNSKVKVIRLLVEMLLVILIVIEEN